LKQAKKVVRGLLLGGALVMMEEAELCLTCLSHKPPWQHAYVTAWFDSTGRHIESQVLTRLNQLKANYLNGKGSPFKGQKRRVGCGEHGVETLWRHGDMETWRHAYPAVPTLPLL
jgi:hypothetical protein